MISAVVLGAVFYAVNKYYYSTGMVEPENTAEKIALMKTLPYIDYTVEKADKKDMGVVYLDPDAVYNGYNLYFDDRLDESFLIDMEGEIIGKWPLSAHIITAQGNIIGSKEGCLSKYTWGGSLIWNSKILRHHEISLTSKNTILTITKEVHEYMGRKVEFDVILEFSQDGKQLFRWSTYENFDKLKKYHTISNLDKKGLDIPKDYYHKDGRSFFGGDYDYYHINSVYSLPSTLLGKSDERFREGNLLVSISFKDQIVILDKKKNAIVWNWGPGEIEFQHVPQMLANGNILIFDNGRSRNYSRVVEIDPVKKIILWEYKAAPPESFHTAGGGFAQRLPNGNTLITETNNGRVFEVNIKGETVWDWYSVKFNKESHRRTVYRMCRFPFEFINKLIQKK